MQFHIPVFRKLSLAELHKRKKIILSILAGAIALLLLAGLAYSYLFGPMQRTAPIEEFLVKPGDTVEHVAASLKEEGYIKSLWAFRIAYVGANEGRGIRPGSYELGKGMDVWTLTDRLVSTPKLAFITFTPGMRKEQMADILADTLSWSDAQKEKWITVDTAVTPSLVEGVYFPDTYLVPSEQDPAQVAARLRGRFQDEFAPYAAKAAEQGRSWTDVLIMASLIEREAAKNDKELVAGILWNRIDIRMPLGVDATLQYIKGT
ncbi:endolytic transglycosylase MltG, partial [Patescibacteria group bacterium]|nr:endolytic transglycosylase MltG [Patescibacteria group bacterium]